MFYAAFLFSFIIPPTSDIDVTTSSISQVDSKDLLPIDLLPKDLRQKVYDHMAVDPSTLPIVTEQFEKYNLPNLQLALNELSEKKDPTVTILGLQVGIMNNITGTAL